MLSQAAARNVVGIIGNVISFGLFLSPVPTFWRIIKAKDTEEFSPNPYLATLLNCMLWVFYGIPVVHPNSILVVTINGIGLVIEATYLTIFFLYANSNKKRKRALAILAVEILFMVVVVLSVLLAAHTHKKRSLIVGVLCIIFGTMMYFSPLTVMLWFCAETSGHDQERGVHALPAVAGELPQRLLLDHLRAHALRPQPHDPQRPGRHLRPRPAHPLRLLLQVHTQEAEERGAAHHRLHQQRQHQRRRQRHRHRRAIDRLM